MSVIDTVKQKVGIEEQPPQYECEDCGERFRSGADEDSYWFQCPECGSEDVRRAESGSA